MSKTFTIAELKKYNGLKGKPSYIAFQGKIYDVSNVFKNGEHAGVKAGTDITETFAKSPHQADIFSKFPVVGKLNNNSLAEKIFSSSLEKSALILRIALGTVFFAHGAQLLLGWFGGYGWAGSMGFFTKSLGIPAFFAGLAILVEFFGGIAILLGLLTRPAAAGLAAIMLTAAIKVHLANGFFLDLTGPKDGIEYTFVLFLIAVYLLIKGAGAISLDSFIAKKLN